jgi:hypothetical protein
MVSPFYFWTISFLFLDIEGHGLTKPDEGSRKPAWTKDHAAKLKLMETKGT